MRRRRFLAALIVPVALIVLAPAAWAYFTSQGAGQGTVSVGSLPVPGGVTATANGSSVDVQWTDVTSPGSGTLGYIVTRTPVPAGPAVAACGSPATPLPSAATACSDGSAPVGTYTYAVSSVYGSWTSTSAMSAAVVVGRVTTSTTLQVATPTATVGSEQLVGLTANVSTQGTALPTGTIVVTAGGTTLCTISLPALSCSVPPSVLAASGAPYAVTAAYSGDSAFDPSTSDPSELTVYGPLVITTQSLAPAWAGETGYSQNLTATGGFGAHSWVVNAGVLPPGLTLNHDSGTISGSITEGDISETVSIEIMDSNRATAVSSFLIQVIETLVGQVTTAPAGTNQTFPIRLSGGVGPGDALVLTLAQDCATGTGVPVNSYVTSVSGDSLTWIRAAATGCASGGDAEIWYGLGSVAGGSDTAIQVTLAAPARVQFANVAEYAHVTGWDAGPGATATGTGSGVLASSGTSNPSVDGELVVGTAFVTYPTPDPLSGFIDPFVALTSVPPDQGLSGYAVDATTGPLALAYSQTAGTTPTAGPWSAAITAFTIVP